MLLKNIFLFLVLLPLVSMTAVFGLLSVNTNETPFHYMFAVCVLLQSLFIFLAYVALDNR